MRALYAVYMCVLCMYVCVRRDRRDTLGEPATMGWRWYWPLEIDIGVVGRSGQTNGQCNTSEKNVYVCVCFWLACVLVYASEYVCECVCLVPVPVLESSVYDGDVYVCLCSMHAHALATLEKGVHFGWIDGWMDGQSACARFLPTDSTPSIS